MLRENLKLHKKSKAFAFSELETKIVYNSDNRGSTAVATEQK
jgi:hypothetical protein